MAKRMFALLLCAIMLLSLGACSREDDPDRDTDPPETETEEQETTEIPETTETEPEEVTLEDLMPYLQLLQSCSDEFYGAEVNQDVSYYRVFSGAEDYINDVTPSNIVEGVCYDSSVTNDPLCACLYLVENFQTEAEVMDYLKKFMTDDVAEAVFTDPYRFTEFEGRLYITYFGRGYGEMILDLDSAQLTAQSGDTCTVTIDRYWFYDEERKSETIEFTNDNGRWKISSVSYLNV